METTYTILGADGQHYGPVTLENLQPWLREGRVTAETQVFRSDLNAWHPAGSYGELGLASAPVVRMTSQAPLMTEASANPATPLPDSAELANLDRRIRSGASWFYWIAAFSVVNSVVALTGNASGFVLGLSITQVVDAMAKGVVGIGLAVGLLAAGALVIFGIFANRKQTWAFLVGILLYGVDTVLTVVFALMSGSLWLGVAIHAWALFSLIAGFRANLHYHRLVRGT